MTAKRGRPRKVPVEGAMAVKVANAIHDGKGGFYPVGAKIVPVDEVARVSLIAKGLAE